MQPYVYTIAALLTIAKTWRQPQRPSTDEGMKKIWHIRTMQHYSPQERNDVICSNMERPRDYRAKSERNKYHMISHAWNLKCDR